MGTRVQMVSWPVRKLALVGRPLSWAPSSDATSPRTSGASLVASPAVASPTTSSSRYCSWARCQASPPAVAQSESAAAAITSAQAATGLLPENVATARSSRVNQLGVAAGQVKVTTFDVVEGHHAGHEPLVGVGHGGPEQGSVQT